MQRGKRHIPILGAGYLRRWVSDRRQCYRRGWLSDVSTFCAFSCILVKGKQVWLLLSYYTISVFFFFKVSIYFAKKVYMILGSWSDKIFVYLAHVFVFNPNMISLIISLL